MENYDETWERLGTQLAIGRQALQESGRAIAHHLVCACILLQARGAQERRVIGVRGGLLAILTVRRSLWCVDRMYRSTLVLVAGSWYLRATLYGFITDTVHCIYHTRRTCIQEYE